MNNMVTLHIKTDKMEIKDFPKLTTATSFILITLNLNYALLKKIIKR